MTQDDLKKYSVIVGNGSGCFFQPMTLDYTYILTAKHLFYSVTDNGQEEIKTEFPDGTTISIRKMVYENNKWVEEPITFSLQKGENYFPHQDENADIAILKVGILPELDKIYFQEEYETDTTYSLCGFPQTLSSSKEGEKYTSHVVEKFNATGNYSRGAQLFGGLNQKNIEGMSGGGILKLENDHISIVGIQSKMAAPSLPAGQIGFVPLSFFNEIIDSSENHGKLQKLLPHYLTSFSFLETEIFKLQSGLISSANVDMLTKILIKKAEAIRNSDITPIYIKDFLSNKLQTLLKNSEMEFQKKKIWSLWLELLTILNVAKSRVYNKSDFSEVFRKVRFIYSDVDSDFWFTHLQDLAHLDYSGLDDDAIVVVASNVKAQDGLHKLEPGKILSHIAKIRQDFNLEILGDSIDNATDFPLEKWKFYNLSVFKEKIVDDVEADFSSKEITECLTTLKSLYEQIIPNW